MLLLSLDWASNNISLQISSYGPSTASAYAPPINIRLSHAVIVNMPSQTGTVIAAADLAHYENTYVVFLKDTLEIAITQNNHTLFDCQFKNINNMQVYQDSIESMVTNDIVRYNNFSHFTTHFERPRHKFRKLTNLATFQDQKIVEFESEHFMLQMVYTEGPKKVNDKTVVFQNGVCELQVLHNFIIFKAYDLILRIPILPHYKAKTFQRLMRQLDSPLEDTDVLSDIEVIPSVRPEIIDVDETNNEQNYIGRRRRQQQPEPDEIIHTKRRRRR